MNRKIHKFKIILTLSPTSKLQKTRINPVIDFSMHSTERLKFQLFINGEYGMNRFKKKLILILPFY